MMTEEQRAHNRRLLADEKPIATTHNFFRGAGETKWTVTEQDLCITINDLTIKASEQADQYDALHYLLHFANRRFLIYEFTYSSNKPAIITSRRTYGEIIELLQGDSNKFVAHRRQPTTFGTVNHYVAIESIHKYHSYYDEGEKAYILGIEKSIIYEPFILRNVKAQLKEMGDQRPTWTDHSK